jgi:hypothetical protein
MDKALAHAISLGIVGFGVWILIAGLSSGAPIDVEFATSNFCFGADSVAKVFLG